MQLKLIITSLIIFSFMSAVNAGTCGSITHPNITVNSTDYGLVPSQFSAVCQIKSAGISPGFVEDNLTLTNNVLWVLEGQVDIGRNIINGNENPILDPNGNNAAVLTIMPGTTVVGDQSLLSAFDYLVIHRGSEIRAEGTASQPIRLTSIDAVSGNTTSAGQWGGLILNGYATINTCSTGNTVPDCESTGLVGEYFGGNDNTDSSGSLAYITISHAAKVLASGVAFNGLALNAVGSETTLSHIQVHESEGNAVTVTGGSAIIRYLVLTHNQSDSLYWTAGWAGSAQFIVGTQLAGSGYFIHGESNSTNAAALPVSFPIIANATVISSSTLPVVRLASGTMLDWFNGVIVSTGLCFEHDAPASENLLMSNTYIQCKMIGQSALEDVWFSNGLFNVETTDSLLNGYINAEILRSAVAVSGSNKPLDNASFVGGVESCDSDWLVEWGSFLPVVDMNECINLNIDVPTLSYLSLSTLSVLLVSIARKRI